MSWRNRNQEQRAEGIAARARKALSLEDARARLNAMVAEYRRRRAAARGISDAVRENLEASD